MKLHIQGMVTTRCVMAVETVLKNLGIRYIEASLGEVRLAERLTPEERTHLARNLQAIGLELIDDKKLILVEQIKRMILNSLGKWEDHPHIKFSKYLEKELQYTYIYLSNTFTEVEGKTIGQFGIEHRIEMVKRLYLDEELTLTEIAYRLNYSSIAHLSSQFKKMTGFTPTDYKNNVHAIEKRAMAHHMEREHSNVSALSS